MHIRTTKLSSETDTVRRGNNANTRRATILAEIVSGVFFFEKLDENIHMAHKSHEDLCSG